MKKPAQSQFLMLFKEESKRYLTGLNEELLKFEKDPDDHELLQAMMRKLHSLKGSANIMGLTDINKFTHRLEDGFLKLKSCEFSPWEFDLLFSSLDIIGKMVDDSTSDKPAGIDHKELDKKLKTLQKKKASAKKPKKKEKGTSKEIDLSVFRADVADFIHIDVSRVDALMGLVNELIIQKGRIIKRPQEIKRIFDQLKFIHKSLRTSVQTSDLPSSFVSQVEDVEIEIRDIRDRMSFLLEDITGQSGRLDHLIGRLEGVALKMRMLPLSIIFSKMQRLVRDLSIDKEKQIKLVFSGENTELDKKIIELIQDPIMHIIRNSVDHGIESPAARKKIGKLPEGIIILNAYQHGNRIVIEIEDDGAGIDKERVKEVARKKGLITDEEAQQLDDNAVFELLFQPEFSTRDEVSSVSGRGVGLNVVRDALNRLQGNIKIDSQQGVFTKFVLDLPITVAVSSILMFTLMGRLYSLPQSEIKETVKLDQPLGDEKTIKLKGEDIPVFTLGDFLDLPKYEHDTPPMLLITEYMNKKVALAVDTLEGEEHVIIKNMGSYLNKVKNIAGAAILSDTRLVLVLDLPEMLAASWKQFAVEK